MTWTVFYLSCFAVGLVLCLLSVFTGGGHGHFHLPGHVHVPNPVHIPGHVHVPAHAHLHTGAAGHSSSSSAPVFNGFTITAFLCWFGGVGYLVETHTGLLPWMVLLVAVASGLAGGSAIFWFLSRVLMPHERELTAEETAITGVVGRLSGPLRSGGTGEILYTQLGVTRSVPARSLDGTPIPREAEVVVLRYEHGIAYVQPWNEFGSGEDSVARSHALQ